MGKVLYLYVLFLIISKIRYPTIVGEGVGTFLLTASQGICREKRRLRLGKKVCLYNNRLASAATRGLADRIVFYCIHDLQGSFMG